MNPGALDLAIVDLGCGNVGSVAIAFERFGLSPRLTSSAQEIEAADKVILPGVGAAGFAMAQMRERGLDAPLKALTQPVLGICLGMQLLFERSEEEDTLCLGLLPGTVRRLEPAAGRPIPHMGWSRLEISPPCKGGVGGGSALDRAPEGHDVPESQRSGERYPPPAPSLAGRGEDLGLTTGDYAYFAHSFACDDGPATAARADYGRPIPAVVRRGNWTGAQFHPEKSGEAGARFLKAWLNA